MLLALLAPVLDKPFVAAGRPRTGWIPPGATCSRRVRRAARPVLVRPANPTWPSRGIDGGDCRGVGCGHGAGRAAATAPPGLDIGQGAFWLQLWTGTLTVTSRCGRRSWPRSSSRNRACSAGSPNAKYAGRPRWHAVAVAASDRTCRFRAAQRRRVVRFGAVRLTAGLRRSWHSLLTARISAQMEVHAAGSALRLAGIAGTGSIAGVERGGRAPLF
jgi:hypothetical protein